MMGISRQSSFVQQRKEKINKLHASYLNIASMVMREVEKFEQNVESYKERYQ